MSDTMPEAGLKREMTVWGMGAAILNGVVGAGIFSLPAAMSQAAGARAPFAFLVCAGVMALVVVCFAEAGSRMPATGGVYSTVAAALGPLPGFLCGMLTWVASVLACGGIAGAFASTLGTVVPLVAAGPGRAVVIVLAIGGTALINLRAVREASWLISVVTAVKLVPLLLFVAVGAVILATRAVAAPPVLAAKPLSGLAEAVILGVFAFSGMETPLAASGEVVDGHRNVPRALFGSMTLVLVLYVSIQLVAQGLLGAGLSGQAAPLAAAAARVGPVARAILVGGAGLSMLAWLASDILGAPRILFAFSRDGLLPRALGRANPRTAAPDVAIITHATLAACLALSGSFTGLVVASALNTAGLYFLGCWAAWVLHRRGVAMLGPPISFAVLPVVAAAGMLAMVVLMCLAPWSEILGLAAVLVASVAIYLVARAAGRRALPAG